MPELPSREDALALMHEYTENESLRKHMYAVEAAMRAYARKYGADEELWGVTGLIHDLYDLAVSEHDYPAQVLLNWFVSEQVEEEKSATEIVERLRMAGRDTAALLMLDKELGERE